jgi:hypothetical protein
MNDIEKKMLADKGIDWLEVEDRADVLADVWGWRVAWLLRVNVGAWDVWLGKYQVWADPTWHAVVLAPAGAFGDAGIVWKDDFWPVDGNGDVDYLASERMGWITERSVSVAAKLDGGARDWCMGWGGKTVHIAKIDVIADGKIVRIVKLPGSRESIPVISCGWTSVQPLKHNLEAVASFWAEGKTAWHHYYVMRTALGHRQRQLAKAGLCDPPPQRKTGRPLKNKAE